MLKSRAFALAFGCRAQLLAPSLLCHNRCRSCRHLLAAARSCKHAARTQHARTRMQRTPPPPHSASPAPPLALLPCVSSPTLLLSQSLPLVAQLRRRRERIGGVSATKEMRRMVSASLATPAVHYSSGTLYGLSHTALARLVRSGCIERLAGSVLCVEAKGTPSTPTSASACITSPCSW